MAVDTIISDVRDAIFKPFDRNISVERCVLDLGVWLKPMNSPAVLSPELVRVLDAGSIPSFVGLGVDMRTFTPFWLDTMDRRPAHRIHSHEFSVPARFRLRDIRLGDLGYLAAPSRSP